MFKLLKKKKKQQQKNKRIYLGQNFEKSLLILNH